MPTHKPVKVEELYGELTPAVEKEKWLVIHTKPKQEKKLAEYSCRNKITYYLPLLDSIRKYKYRKVKFTKPMFPGYVFAKCTFEQKQELLKSGRIVTILKVPDEKELLENLRHIHYGRSVDAPLQKHQYFEKGIEVKIISGPFSGLEGTVESSDKMNKVILKVDLLRQAVSVTVDPSFVRKKNSTNLINNLTLYKEK